MQYILCMCAGELPYFIGVTFLIQELSNMIMSKEEIMSVKDKE